ncbi:MAG: ABC transporter ATP-binding protein [Anaerolineae bacterium]|nr:ABC transporter ATP-binding protein [Anaerolineae bacterium]
MNGVVLRVEGLTKRYGDLTAVDGLSLDIHEGEVFGFLGPNGAGKTTSISMMCGLLKPDSGRVIVHGEPIGSGSADVRARVGVCPQEIVLWKNLTCIEQLQFIGEMYGVPGKVARQRGDHLLDELGLAEKRNKQAQTLSGGMQRRLNLALALVHDPEIVVLDEPEAGLDPQSRVAVREYIRQIARQKTVILTTHNMDEADRLADRVAIIDRGKLLVIDTPDALKRQVGEGDVLEITLPDDQQLEAAKTALADLPNGATVETADHTIHIRVRDAVKVLPVVIEKLQAAAVDYSDLRLRATTLEDVFIQLTGRRLRE